MCRAMRMRCSCPSVSVRPGDEAFPSDDTTGVFTLFPSNGAGVFYVSVFCGQYISLPLFQRPSLSLFLSFSLSVLVLFFSLLRCVDVIVRLQRDRRGLGLDTPSLS